MRDRLPDKLRAVVVRRMREAYHADTALTAQARLATLADELDRTHPGAATSQREGLDETLTVLRLDVPPTLARTLRSTNAIVIWSSSRGVQDVVDSTEGPGFCLVDVVICRGPSRDHREVRCSLRGW